MSINAMLSLNAHVQDERKLKFVRKFMKMARTVADDNNACYSRHIGVVVADRDYRILSMGYNGPPQHTPHTDTYDYLHDFFIPQLNASEKGVLFGTCDPSDEGLRKWCIEKNDCKICPRRFVNAGPGERSTLCSCQHAERNAITNASSDLRDALMFCWCGVPCIDCAGAIINSGIAEVHCLYTEAPDYHPTSRFLLRTGGVELFHYKEDYFS